MPSFLHFLSWKTDLFSLLCSLSIEQYEWNLGHSRIFLANNNSANLDRILSPPTPGHFCWWWLSTMTWQMLSLFPEGESKVQMDQSLAQCSADRVMAKVDEDLKYTHASHTESSHKKPGLGNRTTWFGISFSLLTTSIAYVQLLHFSKIPFSHL